MTRWVVSMQHTHTSIMSCELHEVCPPSSCVCCSGPCMTLVISMGEAGEGALENFRELLGPTSVEEAKESAPERCVIRRSHTRPPPSD